jgi:hypothetical protein
MAPPKGFIPWNKGKTNIYSPEVIESNRLKHLGKKLSEEHKNKIKANASKYWLGKKRVFTEEHKKNMSESCKGKIRSLEHCQNISKAKKGIPKSPEFVEKYCSGKNHPMYGKKGPLAPNWLGGKKFEPYPWTFNKEFKQSIKERDSYACLKCNLCELDHKKIFKGQGLHCHHINYDKKLTILENCCCLCNRCNSEVNYNRDSWTSFFQKILTERYKYKYNRVNDIVIEVKDENI